MRYSIAEGDIPTLRLALTEYMTVDQLRPLAALTGEKLPTTKEELPPLGRYPGSALLGSSP